MNREIADKWTAALRSGKYTQTDGKLKKRWEDGSCSFCALGVLVDLYTKENPDVLLESEWVDGTVAYLTDDDTASEWLPWPVQKWADMVDNKGRFNSIAHPVIWISRNRSAHGQVATVSEANDFGLYFDEVADLIDRHRDTM